MSEIEVKLADVGEGLDEAEIVNWLVAEGTSVAADQDVVEVETAKSIVTIPSPQLGVIARHVVAVGETVPVGGTLYVLRVGDESTAESQTVGLSGRTSPLSPGDVSHDSTSTRTSGSTAVIGAESGSSEKSGVVQSVARRPLASPAVRRRARELGLDLSNVSGTGPHGRIVDADLQAAAAVTGSGASDAESSTAPPPCSGSSDRHDSNVPQAYVKAVRPDSVDRTESLRGSRRTIARNMVRSWRTVPHITDVRRLDVHRLVRARAELNQFAKPDGTAYSYMPFLVKAVALAARAVPEFNASVDEEKEIIEFKGSINVGVATHSARGLVVPVLHKADQLTLRGIRDALGALVPRARAGALSPAEMGSGTITITNYGTFGGWIATPIIRPPESACVGFGRLQDEVVAENGLPVVRAVMAVSISGDHRLIDGHLMAEFYKVLTRLLEHPITLLEED